MRIDTDLDQQVFSLTLHKAASRFSQRNPTKKKKIAKAPFRIRRRRKAI